MSLDPAILADLRNEQATRPRQQPAPDDFTRDWTPDEQAAHRAVLAGVLGVPNRDEDWWPTAARRQA